MKYQIRVQRNQPHTVGRPEPPCRKRQQNAFLPPKKIAEDAKRPPRDCVSPRAALRLFSARLGSGLLRRWFLLGLRLPAADQRQGIRGVEWELANRGFARRAQSDVHPAIARHSDRHYVLEDPLPLFRSQIGIARDLTLYFLSGQVVFLAVCLGVDVGLGNTPFDQEGLDTVDAALGKRLVEFRRPAMISVTAKNQVRIRLALKILLEVVSQRDQRLLLTGQQTTFGIADPRLINHEVNAVQRQPGFQPRDLRIDLRWRRGLDRHLCSGLRSQTASVSAGGVDG